jgi:hypothetical protein
VATAGSGRGGLVLLAGEAGVGKTRLATEVLNRSGLLTLRVAASLTTASAYGPLVATLAVPTIWDPRADLCQGWSSVKCENVPESAPPELLPVPSRGGRDQRIVPVVSEGLGSTLTECLPSG